MSTVDSTFLIITACALSLFFILGAIVLGFILALIARLRKILLKAESAIDSVEEATETIRNIGQEASGPLAILKVIANIVKLTNNHRGRKRD